MDTTTSAGTTSALYTYDAVSRLRAECYPVTGAVCTAKSPRNAYTYDLVGNRATETSRTVVGTKATTVVTDYTYDAAYQLLTKSVGGTPTVTNTWSPNGALATSTTPTGTQTYTTDLTDELISLTLENGSTVGYTQDAQGNRTSRTVDGVLDATWAWDDLSSLPMRIGEYDPAGTLTTGWLPDPTSSTGASLAQTSGGASSWLLSDPFANTVATVSTTGNTVSGTRTMDAFGVQRTTATGSLADASAGFAGQYLDTATGLYDMRARDYDPTSGRFTATDPIAVHTGLPYVASYSYAYNNSLMFSDASGQKALGQYDYADGGSYRPVNRGTYLPPDPTPAATPRVSDFCQRGAAYRNSPHTDNTWTQEEIGYAQAHKYGVDYANRKQTDVGRFLRFIANSANPLTQIVAGIATIDARATGAQCEFNSQEMYTVCYGAGAGYIWNGGGTMWGTVFVTPYTKEEIATLDLNGRNTLVHEGRHATLEAFIGVGGLGGVEGVSGGLNALVGAITGDSHPFSCNVVEWDADYSDGGYTPECKE